MIETSSQEISLVAMGRFLWRNLMLISVCVLAFAAAATAASYLVTPRYRAEVTFSPITEAPNFGQMSGEIGNLAAIAGINIGGGGRKADEALEYLRSHAFAAEFIQKHSLVPILYANKWDAQSGRWRGEAPTLGEAVKRFSGNRVRQISEDRRTGMVTLAIIWSDRNLAAQWANSLVAEADDELRRRAVAELGRSIEYLQQEAARAPNIEIRAAVYKVMESELKDQMVARTRDSYAFAILDPAVPPDLKDKDSPTRMLYLAVGAALGLFVGCIWAMGRRRAPDRTR
ncbi:MAG: Wzz/FepE/Etk N-terminal domain-containing protein [Steroidobacteraceae bacterium]